MNHPSADASRVSLRIVEERDLPTLYEYQRQPEANEMAAFPAREHDAFMAHWKRIFRDESCIAMCVIVDECVAGHLGCWTQDGQRLVGYWLGKQYWGQGIATKMLSIFLCQIADRPVHAYVAKHNVASIRVLEKCGFKPFAAAPTMLGNEVDSVEELGFVFGAVMPDVQAG